MHLIIDGYGSNPQLLQKEEFIYEFLDCFPSQIGMTKISPPYVCTYIGPKPEDGGISGFVLIAESHISIHTFVEHSFVNVDIFSCKDFDVDRAIKDLREWLQLTKLRSYLLHRGMDYREHIIQTASLKSIPTSEYREV